MSSPSDSQVLPKCPRCRVASGPDRTVPAESVPWLVIWPPGAAVVDKTKSLAALSPSEEERRLVGLCLPWKLLKKQLKAAATRHHLSPWGWSWRLSWEILPLPVFFFLDRCSSNPYFQKQDESEMHNLLGDLASYNSSNHFKFVLLSLKESSWRVALSCGGGHCFPHFWRNYNQFVLDLIQSFTTEFTRIFYFLPVFKCSI